MLKAKTLKIWSALSLTHLCIWGLSTVLGSDRLSAFVAGTIYLPLWPADKLGLPVFELNQWMIPPPNALGWVFLIIFWALIYLGLSSLITRILQFGGKRTE